MKLRLPDRRRHANHARGRRAAAVIEQDIDRTQLLARSVNGMLHARPVREVRREAERSAATRFDFRYGAIENGLGSREQRHRNAFGGERVGHAPPDSLAAAENECRFFLELKIHWSFSSRVRL